MKKIYSILFLLIAVSLGFSSCSDDDVVKTQLEAPAISSDITKATSLSFNWQPVAGATQYAYELYDANDNRVLFMRRIAKMAAMIMLTQLKYTISEMYHL